MGDRTKIEWTDATWNPIRGCSRVSEGCRNCYAERQAIRLSGPGQPYEGLVRSTDHGPRWTGQVRLAEDVLEAPLRWRRPRRIFVNSMSDLFHENVPDEWIDEIFGVMAKAYWHTFQVLTNGGPPAGPPGGGGGHPCRDRGRVGRLPVPIGEDRPGDRGQPGAGGVDCASQDREEDRKCRARVLS